MKIIINKGHKLATEIGLPITSAQAENIVRGIKLEGPVYATGEIESSLKKIPEVVAGIKESLLLLATQEADKLMEASFDYEGKKVRCTSADLTALSEFMHLTKQSTKDWDKGRIWFAAGAEYADVPLPTSEVAGGFGVAMIEHKEAFTRARILLARLIVSAESVEELEKINIKDAEHWPV